MHAETAQANGRGASRDSTRRGVALAAAGLVAILYISQIAPFWTQVNDDAFITFRYSKFVTLGEGPYFNPGERVEGYSNFLTMWWMAAAIAALGDARALTVAKVTGVAAGLAALLFTGLLCRAWLRRLPGLSGSADLLAWIAPALLAVQSGYALNSTTGLETTLFSAWIVLGLWLAQKAADDGRWRGAGIAFAAAVLTRPEGAAISFAAMAGVAAGGAWSRPDARRRLVTDAAWVIAAVAGLLLFRWIVYEGHLLPNTYHAKIGGLGGRAGAVHYVAGFLRKHLAYLAWVPAFLTLLAPERAVRRDFLPALSVLLFGFASIFFTGADWMPGYRMLAPVLPVWAALTVAGLFAVVPDRAVPGRNGVGAFACVALAAGLFLWQQPVRAAYVNLSDTRARGYAEGHEALADWLLDHTRPGETVALMDIGIVGFRCIDRTILDITGLTDRHIATLPGGFLDKPGAPDYVLERRPEVLVVAYAAAPDLEFGGPVAFVPWSPIERVLTQHEEFQRLYVHPRPVDPGAPLLERLAAQSGAEIVFRHAYPGRSYLLFAFVLDPGGS